MANTFEPILDSGLRSISFFNGRLLSAEDLTLEQAAQRQERQWLGQASGDGVAYGLEVAETTGVSTTTAPVFTVKAGLAVNRNGQALYLKKDTDLTIVRPKNGTTTTADSITFKNCDPLKAGEYVAGKGLYLLTISPAQTNEGRAQVSGLGNATAACNIRYTVASVQFNLIQVPVASSDVSDLMRVRNRLAYKCFGVDDAKLTGFLANPFGPVVDQYGLLDDLRPRCLTDDDVPLAILYYTSTGLQYLDKWSVRRRITQRSTDAAWPLLTADRRVSEAQAMFLQFQDQIEELRVNTSENAESIVATSRFRYLPPVGIVPIASNTFPRGFHPDLFFDTIVHHPVVHIEGARLKALVNAALQYPPIDLNDHVMIWIYYVRENKQETSTQPYLVFSSGHMAYMGDPHFDVNRWDFGNLA